MAIVVTFSELGGSIQEGVGVLKIKIKNWIRSYLNALPHLKELHPIDFFKNEQSIDHHFSSAYLYHTSTPSF